MNQSDDLSIATSCKHHLFNVASLYRISNEWSLRAFHWNVFPMEQKSTSHLDAETYTLLEQDWPRLKWAGDTLCDSFRCNCDVCNVNPSTASISTCLERTTCYTPAARWRDAYKSRRIAVPASALHQVANKQFSACKVSSSRASRTLSRVTRPT